MNQFAKLFTVGDYQVVAYKDFEEINDEASYRIVTLVGIEGGAQQIAYGYKSEEKRDAKFEEFDEAGARISLDVVLQAFAER